MRLICPNCEAQYEVPDDVIPAAGRDVQCSNCGNTWFQKTSQNVTELPHPQEDSSPNSEDQGVVSQEIEKSNPEQSVPFGEETSQELPEPKNSSTKVVPNELDADDLDLEATDWDITLDETWEPPSSYDVQTDDSFEEDALNETSISKSTSDKKTASETADDNKTEAEPRRRGLDVSVADILREEAAFETQARAAESPQSIETQEEFALPARGVNSNDQIKERSAVGTTNKEETGTNTSALSDERSPRRDLLPDIEEINSTLRNSEKPQRKSDQGKAMEEVSRRSSGFRLGFVSVLLIAATAVFFYSSQDKLRAQFPVMTPTVDSFVASTNMARIWLDEKATALLLAVSDKRE